MSLGVVASCIPLANLNQPTKLIASCKMLKQGMGAPVNTQVSNHHGVYSVLKTPEIPIVIPQRLKELFDVRLLYSGQNVVTAVMTIEGYNQEDGLVFSQGAVKKGLFTSLHYHTYRLIEPCFGEYGMQPPEKDAILEAGDVVIQCKNAAHHNVVIPSDKRPAKVIKSSVVYLVDGSVMM